MSSNKIIICVLILFVVVGAVGSFAGYSQPIADPRPANDFTDDEAAQPGWLLSKWQSVCDWFWGGSIGQMVNPRGGGGGIAFLYDIAVFNVEGMPMVISAVFWIAGLMMAVAIFRVILGTLGGGSG
jgi:hypothetical protein